MRSTFYAIVGTPPAPVKDRPQCKWCGKPLEANWNHDYDRQTKTWLGTYGERGSGNFCKTLHALWWADKTIEQIKNRVITVQLTGNTPK